MYYLEDGEKSDDGDLCSGGHVNKKSSSSTKKCVSVTHVRLAGSSALLPLKAPYKCDMSKGFKCMVKYTDGKWVSFGDCACSFRKNNEAFCKFPGA